MNSPAAPFSAAQRLALEASEALRLAMGGTLDVYVEVPQNAKPPYVVVGADQIDDLSDGCGDAHSIVANVVWFAKLTGDLKGSDVARRMGAAIVEIHLADGLAVAGHDVVLAIMERPEEYATQPDQSTRGSAAFRYETTAQD